MRDSVRSRVCLPGHFAEYPGGWPRPQQAGSRHSDPWPKRSICTPPISPTSTTPASTSPTWPPTWPSSSPNLAQWLADRSAKLDAGNNGCRLPVLALPSRSSVSLAQTGTPLPSTPTLLGAALIALSLIASRCWARTWMLGTEMVSRGGCGLRSSPVGPGLLQVVHS
jgi:hypothetical protein